MSKGDARSLSDLAGMLRQISAAQRDQAAQFQEHAFEHLAVSAITIADQLAVAASHIEEGRWGDPDKVIRDDWTMKARG